MLLFLEDTKYPYLFIYVKYEYYYMVGFVFFYLVTYVVVVFKFYNLGSVNFNKLFYNNRYITCW